jgi:hypothetical protein
MWRRCVAPSPFLFFCFVLARAKQQPDRGIAEIARVHGCSSYLQLGPVCKWFSRAACATSMTNRKCKRIPNFHSDPSSPGPRFHLRIRGTQCYPGAHVYVFESWNACCRTSSVVGCVLCQVSHQQMSSTRPSICGCVAQLCPKSESARAMTAAWTG